MRLFKRKPTNEDMTTRCPDCGERVPAGVRQCTMCGRSLVDVPIELRPPGRAKRPGIDPRHR